MQYLLVLIHQYIIFIVITYKDREYKCYIDDDLIFDNEMVLDASQSILSALKNKNILRRIGSNKNGQLELIQFL